MTTPVSVGQKLVKATEESELFDEALYQSAIGSLLTLSAHAREGYSSAFSVCL